MTGGGRRSARSRVKSSADDNEDNLRRAKPNLKYRRDRSKDSTLLRIFNANLSIMIGLSILALLIIYFVISHVVNPVEEAQRPRVVTPFPAPKLMDLPMVGKVYYVLSFCYATF